VSADWDKRSAWAAVRPASGPADRAQPGIRRPCFPPAPDL